MDRDEYYSETAAVVVVAALGSVTLLAHVLHLGVHSLAPVGFVFGALIPMACSAALLSFAWWLATADFGDLAFRVATWSVVGSVALVSLASVFVVFQLAVGGTVAEVPLVVVIQATVGGLLGFLLGVYDTQRLAMRRELRAERESADLLGRRLTVLNRVLRHDIRNAVSVIRGNAEMIHAGTGDPETVARTIQDHAVEMARLSDQAREVEAALSRDEVETERIDLSTSVSAKALALAHGHQYATVHREVAEGAWVEASPLVEAAVDNLLENAVEHNDAASPTVWVEVEVADRDGREVVSMRIADDGPGIPPAQIAVLERGHETALEHTSGLGLWLVSWIVTESGGTVSFEERTPRGSVVEVVLPRVDPPEDEAGAEG